MSGPKCHSCRVVSEAELRRRENEARARKCKSLLARCNSALRELSDPSNIIVPSAKSENYADLVAWETALRDTLEQIQLQSDKEFAAIVVSKMRSNEPHLDTSAIAINDVSRQVARKTGESGIDSAEIKQLLAHIASLHDKRRASELLDEAASIGGSSDPAQAKGDLLSPKSEINRLLVAQELQELASEELLSIEGLDSPSAARARTLASSIATHADLDSLKKAVAEAKDEHERRLDESYISSALTEVLIELGYEVTDGFKLTNFGQVAIAEHPEYPGYALRSQINSSNGSLLTRMVSFEEHTIEEDSEVENSTCKHIHLLREKMSDRGVELHLTMERPAGSRPVETIAPNEKMSSARITKKSANQAARFRNA